MTVCVNVIKSSLSLWILLLLLYYHQGIYNYIPEAKHVSRVCSVAGVLYLQFVLHVMLSHVCFYISTSRSMCAVPNMAVFLVPLLVLLLLVLYYVVQCMKFHVDIFPTKYMKC
jgi:hypothetical protein